MRELAKLRNLWKTLGASTTAMYLVDRAGGRAGGVVRARSYRLVAQPVRAEPRCPAGRGKAYAAREIGRGDPALAHFPIDAAVLAFRFGQGARCLGLFRGDLPVACIWLRLGAFEEDEVRCRFVPAPAGAASWDFDVYVDPAHRLGPAFARLWDEADAFLRAHGVAWSVSRISAVNAASLGSHARLGATTVGTAHFLSLGAMQLTLSTLRPRVHLALTRRHRPTVQVPAPAGPHPESARAPGAAIPAGDPR